MSKETMTLALEALKNYDGQTWEETQDAIKALEEALAKQEQGEPDLIECGNCHEGLADMEHVCKKCLGAGWVNNPKQEQGEPVACTKCKKLEDELEHLRIKSKLWKRDAIVWKSAYDVEVGWREQEQGKPVAYLVTGPYEKQPFANIGAAASYCKGLNKGFGEDAYTVNSLYTTPQPAQKPLTDEQIMDLYNEPRSDAEMLAFARAIEAAHGIKE